MTYLCSACREEVAEADVSGESHLRLDTETYADYGHACGGDDRECSRRCPVMEMAQRQMQVECGPVTLMTSSKDMHECCVHVAYEQDRNANNVALCDERHIRALRVIEAARRLYDNECRWRAGDTSNDKSEEDMNALLASLRAWDEGTLL